jgi:hypothetical protein
VWCVGGDRPPSLVALLVRKCGKKECEDVKCAVWY